MIDPLDGARALFLEGVEHHRNRRHAEAFEAYESALRLDPGLALAWRHRGHLLRRAGRLADASACYERALELGDVEVLNRYFLAATGVGDSPAASPPAYVADLFDEYADSYDAEMVGELRYSGHFATAKAVFEFGGDSFGSALDLGCGTGLVAAHLRPFALRLTGVDMSSRMIAAASRTGLYDELTHSDLLTHLQTTSRQHDLVICCDVFIYIGDLAPVFAAVARVLEAGGVFAFSVEAGGAASGFDLLPSLRFCHSEPYLRALASAHGLEVRGIARGPLRVERDEPLAGLFVVLASRPVSA